MALPDLFSCLLIADISLHICSIFLCCDYPPTTSRYRTNEHALGVLASCFFSRLAAFVWHHVLTRIRMCCRCKGLTPSVQTELVCGQAATAEELLQGVGSFLFLAPCCLLGHLSVGTYKLFHPGDARARSTSFQLTVMLSRACKTMNCSLCHGFKAQPWYLEAEQTPDLVTSFYVNHRFLWVSSSRQNEWWVQWLLLTC